MVGPCDSHKQCCNVFFEKVSGLAGGERPGDAKRVCHSNSPVSGAVLRGYKEAAITKPLATTEWDCLCSTAGQ